MAKEIYLEIILKFGLQVKCSMGCPLQLSTTTLIDEKNDQSSATAITTNFFNKTSSGGSNRAVVPVEVLLLANDEFVFNNTTTAIKLENYNNNINNNSTSSSASQQQQQQQQNNDALDASNAMLMKKLRNEQMNKVANPKIQLALDADYVFIGSFINNNNNNNHYRKVMMEFDPASIPRWKGVVIGGNWENAKANVSKSFLDISIGKLSFDFFPQVSLVCINTMTYKNNYNYVAYI
jgi:hypothetical protein